MLGNFTIKIIESNIESKGETHMLQKAQNQRKNILLFSYCVCVRVFFQLFPPQWGQRSLSATVWNLAWWHLSWAGACQLHLQTYILQYRLYNLHSIYTKIKVLINCLDPFLTHNSLDCSLKEQEKVVKERNPSRSGWLMETRNRFDSYDFILSLSSQQRQCRVLWRKKRKREENSRDLWFQVN